jgi:CHAT domain-containing protein
LPASQSEIDTVRDSFRQHFAAAPLDLLQQDAATESAFRQQAGRHRVLHLATHGFFAPARLKSALAPDAEADNRTELFAQEGVNGFHPGLLSGLALSGANVKPKEGEDNGILTAIEVQGMDLRGVELVVLSACETGLGEVAGGEGVLGLQRAFQIAGAETVVASLWKVPDEATSLLMRRFYANLWDRKMTRLGALREAQLWVLRGGEDPASTAPPPATAERRPPVAWAAFVLSGDWN